MARLTVFLLLAWSSYSSGDPVRFPGTVIFGENRTTYIHTSNNLDAVITKNKNKNNQIPG
jgi:hypothetical protein